MNNSPEERQIAKNWREYFGQIRESFQVFGWVWREFTTPLARRMARGMLVMTVLATLLHLVQPWFLGRLIDGLARHDGRLVVWSILAVIGLKLLTRGLTYLQWRARERMMAELIVRLDVRSTELFLEKSLGQHLCESSVLNVGNVDKGRSKALGVAENLTFNGIGGLMDLLVAFGFLWVLSPVAGAMVTALLVWFALTSLYMNRRCIEVGSGIDNEWRRVNRRRFEIWDKVDRVKTCGHETAEAGWVQRELSAVIGKDLKLWYWFMAVASGRGLADVVYIAAVLAFAASQVWDGAWTVGMLFPIMTWSGACVDNLWRIGQIEFQLNSALPAVASLKRALTLAPDIVDQPGAVDLPADRVPRVVLEAVRQTYATPKIEDGVAPAVAAANAKPVKPVLEQVDLIIEPGDKVALIGPSGVGKTTVMRLVQRYMDPGAGRVLADGQDLRDVRLGSWRRLIGYIPQQAQVFDGTIRSNLTYGLEPEARERVTDADLWKLMRRLQIDFGDRLTEGLNTKVGRHGIKLSGGESQRLMIGSAVLRRPRLMVIDEATSSLDSTTEKAVQRGLAEALTADMSALIIAHRLSTVRRLCNKFVVLSDRDGGATVEAVAGSFEELYAASPTFRQLADDQGVTVSPVAKAPAPDIVEIMHDTSS